MNYILYLILLGIGALGGGKTGGYESSSRDRLVYLITCLIGHLVEVHVNNGSIYTGIFHATDAEKDFGMVFYFFILIIHLYLVLQIELGSLRILLQIN